MITIPLFLLSLSFFSLKLRSLLPYANEACVGSSQAQCAVSVLFSLNILDLDFLNLSFVNNWYANGNLLQNTLARFGLLDICSRGIALLMLANTAREEDESFLIFL